jgi:large subunit ribosomal protein L21
MYAVVTTGGKQIRVSEGDVVRVEKLDAAVGDKVELDQVNMIGKDDGVVLDKDALAKAKVVCQVKGEGRRKKILVFKYKRRKGYRRTQGHRQSYTELQVEKIKA